MNSPKEILDNLDTPPTREDIQTIKKTLSTHRLGKKPQFIKWANHWFEHIMNHEEWFSTPSDSIVASDPVLKPAHYQGNVECIDAIRAQLSDDEWRGYLRGQIAKYNWRLGRKDAVDQEAGKLLFYASLLAGKDPRK